MCKFTSKTATILLPLARATDGSDTDGVDFGPVGSVHCSGYETDNLSGPSALCR